MNFDILFFSSGLNTLFIRREDDLHKIIYNIFHVFFISFSNYSSLCHKPKVTNCIFTSVTSFSSSKDFKNNNTPNYQIPSL